MVVVRAVVSGGGSSVACASLVVLSGGMFGRIRCWCWCLLLCRLSWGCKGKTRDM